MKKRVLLIVVLVIALTATVWHRATRANEPLPDSFCPRISDIQKNPKEGNWTAETSSGSWKSHELSFATDLTVFVGAQWAGENVGQLTCVYNSEQKFTLQKRQIIQETLPVLLVFNTLALEPVGEKWKRVKPGIHNCYANEQSDCPFKINPKPQVGNIYEEAESLKSIPDSNSQPPTD